MEVGAVAAMRFVKDGIKAAKLVMDHTEHTLIVGEKASIFAISMGLQGPTNLSSPESLEKWIRWKRNSCQPNFRKNVIPTNSCGPYYLSDSASTLAENSHASSQERDFRKNWPEDNTFIASKSNSIPDSHHYHDTISMAVIDKGGRIAVGTSTNGATFKIPGRVGDGPIAGSSAYADDKVGACGATGDGDIMMRFLPCYQVVESMRQGMEPKLAAADAISRIARKYPDFVGAIFALNKNGVHAGACHGWTFQYSVRSPVGPGGSPDENGETTLDALVMNGTTMEVGAVAAMRYIKQGIKAAKLVMDHTKHTLIAGEKASNFAISMGLHGPSNLSSPESLEEWIIWKCSSCQPNFRKNVIPADHCGPYHLSDAPSTFAANFHSSSPKNDCGKIFPEGNMFVPTKSNSIPMNHHNHDTISMAVIDKAGRIAVGTSTNGLTFKIPGRVGDGPIAGSSAYADDEVGACGATGNGDIMMRFCPCYQVVESMRRGMDPKLAAADAISRIARKYPDFFGAVFAINKNGVHAGACHGMIFQYSVRTPGMKDVEIITVMP